MDQKQDVFKINLDDYYTLDDRNKFLSETANSEEFGGSSPYIKEPLISLDTVPDKIEDHSLSYFEKKMLVLGSIIEKGAADNYSINEEGILTNNTLKIGKTNDDILDHKYNVSSKQIEFEKKDLNIEQVLEEKTEIIISNLDGTKKIIVLGEESKTKEELIKNQLTELKEYINSNKDKIESLEVKQGNKYHKKIPLKDFINKELNTTNYTSNPEKLGEDLILSLLKPLKIFNNYLAQNKLEKNHNIKDSQNLNPKIYTVGINNEEYQFKKYSDDFKKIIVQDKEGKPFELNNDKNINFIIGPEKQLSETELNLIGKGKSLIAKTDIPFKISNEEGAIKFQTITSDDYIKNLDVTAKQVQVQSKNVSNKLI